MGSPVAKQLRQIARQLGLSDAEVARRAGLSDRRYGHYVTGRNEPDLSTLLRLCKTLNVSPNELLGYEHTQEKRRRRAKGNEGSRVIDRIVAAVSILDPPDQEVVTVVAETLVRRNTRKKPMA